MDSTVCRSTPVCDSMSNLMTSDNQSGLDDGDVKVVMRRRERNRPQQAPSYDTTFLELDADELNVDEFFRSAHLPKGDFLSIQTGWAEKELPPKIGSFLLCSSRTQCSLSYEYFW